MDIVGAIKEAFRATAEIFGYSRDRSKLKNAADVKAAKKAQEEVDAKSKVEIAILKRDIKALRKDLAE